MCVGGGVARVSELFLLRIKNSKSKYFFFFFFLGGGGGGGGGAGGWSK